LLPTSITKNSLILILFFFVSSFLFQNLFADVIELQGNKKLFGQLISITEESIHIETLSKTDASFQNIFLPRSKVISVKDESGTILFSENTQHIHVLKRYYEEMNSNWEELNDHFKASKHDSVIFKTGEKRGGKIFSITKKFLFMEKTSDDQAGKIEMDKISLKKINRIGKIKVLYIDPQKPRPKPRKKIEYPIYSLSGGLVFTQTNYDQLQDLFQEFYDVSGIPVSSKKRLAAYPGLQAKFEVFIKPYLSFGLTGILYKTERINSLSMTMADLKYTFYQIPLRPWFSAGFAGHDFSSTEKIDGTEYVWDTSKGTVSIGLGMDIGDELDTGYIISAYYLPFGKGTTEIRDSDIDVKKELDFTFILISVGMRFNFN